jgi:transposase-like protein
MDCPHCHSSSTTEREERTVHGFRRFRCRECGRRFNERTATALNRIQAPTDIVFSWSSGGCATSRACVIWQEL